MTHEEFIAAGYETNEDNYYKKIRIGVSEIEINILQEDDSEPDKITLAEIVIIDAVGSKRNTALVNAVIECAVYLPESLSEVESKATALYHALLGNPTVSEFLRYCDLHTNDDPEGRGRRSEKYDRLLAAAKAEIGGAI